MDLIWNVLTLYTTNICMYMYIFIIHLVCMRFGTNGRRNANQRTRNHQSASQQHLSILQINTVLLVVFSFFYSMEWRTYNSQLFRRVYSTTNKNQFKLIAGAAAVKKHVSARDAATVHRNANRLILIITAQQNRVFLLWQSVPGNDDHHRVNTLARALE